jgi:hypothetical protein
MNLKTLSDEALLKITESLVKQEREILSQVLHHLREIDRRRLYCKLKFGSLYDYATKELGYSEDQAYRRIQAMRLLKELPQIEREINEGSLSLSHLGIAHSLFRREQKAGSKPFSIKEKMEILDKLKNTSKREAEKITATYSPYSSASTETIKAISVKSLENKSEIKFEIKLTVNEDQLRKIDRLKSLLAHKRPGIEMSELVELLCDLGFEKWDKSIVKENESKAKAKEIFRAGAETESSAQLKRKIWQRDKGQCQNCGSRYAVEIDHRLPKAFGGEENKDNLRLLCKSCNQRAAINVFGIKKIEKYIGA